MNEPVVLVTGGAGNVGRAVTRRLPGGGARVAVPVYKTDAPSRPRRAARAPTATASTPSRSTSPPSGARSGRCSRWWSGAAGWTWWRTSSAGTPAGLRIADTPVEVLDRMLDLNLRSAWLVARFAIPAMVGGAAARWCSSPPAPPARTASGRAAYAVAKAGAHHPRRGDRRGVPRPGDPRQRRAPRHHGHAGPTGAACRTRIPAAGRRPRRSPRSFATSRPRRAAPITGAAVPVQGPVSGGGAPAPVRRRALPGRLHGILMEGNDPAGGLSSKGRPPGGASEIRSSPRAIRHQYDLPGALGVRPATEHGTEEPRSTPIRGCGR